MVFKILRAGRKVRALGKALENEKELLKYMEATAPARGKHRLSEDMIILQKEVDWLRFSKPAQDFIRSMGDAGEGEASGPAEGGKEGRQLPFATVEDVLMDPDRFKGKNVIIDGELELYNRLKSGERWHIFSDSGAVVTAVSGKELSDGPGTLFAIARQTRDGKQVYLEALNFRPGAPNRE